MAAPLTPDLCVIGAGAAGQAVALAARRLGAEVVVIERGAAGGQSLRSGALPLHALAAAAARAQALRDSGPFGVVGEEPRVNFRKVHDHIDEVIAAAAPDSGFVRLAALGIDIIAGSARFIDPRTVSVGDEQIRARRFVIATGASSVRPDIAGLDGVPYFTTETIFDNTRKLSHLLVIGAGPMGLELGLSYRRLGCEVTIIEPGSVLAGSDPELAEIALRSMREDGVTIVENAAVSAVQPRSQGIGIVVRAGGQTEMLDVSHIVVASGRRPNIDELGLEFAALRRARGDITGLDLNGSLRTSNPRIYAAGEAAGHAGSAHAVTLEAELVVRAALLGQASRYDATAVPRLTLTDPEIAEIGLTEPMARARFKDGYRVHRIGFAENDKARAMRTGPGLVKLIADTSGRLLGAGIVGTGAGDVAALLSLALARRLTIAELGAFVPPYPTLAGLVRRLGDAAHASTPPSGLDRQRFALNRLLP